MVVILGVIAVIWVRVAFAGFAVAVRGLVRVGLYDPSNRTPRRSVKRQDRGFLLFNRVLRGVSRLVPTNPHQSVFPYMIPLLVVGIPAGVVMMSVFLLVPALLMMRVATVAPSGWSHLFVLITFFGYYGLISVVVGLWKRAPVFGGGYIGSGVQ